VIQKEAIMGIHDKYGKDVMHMAAGQAFDEYLGVNVDYGAGRGAKIDGVVNGTIAVEIDSRVSKQVRGAVLDLILHRFPKKLLVLIPAHMENITTTATQCIYILGKFFNRTDFEVVPLQGTGHNPQYQIDVQMVKAALSKL
jgi:hypothetical protein